jgi:hypothetical protein
VREARFGGISVYLGIITFYWEGGRRLEVKVKKDPNGSGWADLRLFC